MTPKISEMIAHQLVPGIGGAYAAGPLGIVHGGGGGYAPRAAAEDGYARRRWRPGTPGGGSGSGSGTGA